MTSAGLKTGTPNSIEDRRTLRDRVSRYYRENQFFYDFFWTDRATRSMNYGFWDQSTFRLGHAFRNQNRAIAAALNLQRDDVVLEAGCGTGGTAVCFAVEHDIRALGVTLCRNQAARGNSFAARRGVRSRASFLVMDFTQLGFPDGTFTKLFASESACYAPDKGEFAAEAYRVLRPGGRIVVVDFFASSQVFGPAERTLFESWLAGWALPGLATSDEFAAGLRRAGFRNVEFREGTEQIMPSARRIQIRGVLGRPWFQTLKSFRLLSETHFAHVRSSIEQYRVLRDRIAVYGMFTADR